MCAHGSKNLKTRLLILMLNFTVIFIASGSLLPPDNTSGEQVGVLKINREYDKRTMIKKSLIPNGGNGLFAAVKIKKGEVIGELGGRLVADNDESLGNHYIASIPKCAWQESHPYKYIDSKSYGANVSRINF